MTPVELCEQLFQYVCRVNRSNRKKVPYVKEQVRAEVKGLLDDVRERAAGDPQLAAQFDATGGKLLLVLKCFVDFTIRTSDLSFRNTWQNLAQEDGVADGDRKFWELLEETIRDTSTARADRLPVFYTCIGLGFVGDHPDKPNFLTEKMLEISALLRGRLDVNASGRVCPEAYEHTNTADLIKPPGTSLAKIGIALFGMLLVVFVANAVLYLRGKADYSDSLKRLKEAKPAGAAASAAVPSATPVSLARAGGD